MSSISSDSSDDNSTRASSRLSSDPSPESGTLDPRQRSRVRSVVPTRRETEREPLEAPPDTHYSSSSSDGEESVSESADYPGDRASSRTSSRDNEAPNSEVGTRDRSDSRYRSVRLGHDNQVESHGRNVVPARGGTYSSFRLRQRPTTPDRVVWEPEFKQKVVKQKSKKAIKKVIQIKPKVHVQKPVERKEKKSCFHCCKRKPKDTDSETELEPEIEELPGTELSPEMEKANSEGYEMMKKIFFPSIPALLQDLWVYLELAISIAAFVIGMLGLFPIKTDVVFQYVYLVLASIAMFMALLDGFIYFFQLGSCARGIRFCMKALKERNKKGEEEDDDEEEEEPKKSCGMSPETQEKFNTWFELARNLINEFLVYPLLVCDLFDYISEGLEDGFVPEAGNGLEGTDFGFFVIGGFYLLLAVYIMRVVMVLGTLLSLVRLPSNKKASGSDKGVGLVIKFCIHVIGQIAVHLIIILVLAAKIHNENNTHDDEAAINSTLSGSMNMTFNQTGNMTMEDEEGGGLKASPFLLLAIVMGGVLPLAGVAAFFIVNYFWMREFSMGFWLNMLSMLQGASFAESVFGGDGLEPATEQANQFLDDSGFDTVKVQIGRYKSQSWWTKFLYPTKVPFVALSGVLYDLALLAFIVALMLTLEDGHVRLVVFRDDNIMTSMFVIATTTILIANLHVLLLLNFLLLMLIVLGILAALYSAVLAPFILFVYLPSMGLLGYYLFLRDTAKKCCCCCFKAPRDDEIMGKNSTLGRGYELSVYKGSKEKEAAEELNYEEDYNLGNGNRESPLVFANLTTQESFA